jgi:hypothetical protein
MVRNRKKFIGAIGLDEWEGMNREQRRRAFKAGYLPPLAGGSFTSDAIESNIFGLWAAMQPEGRGTPADMTVGSKMLRWIGGDVTTARSDGTEDYSDNTLFGPTVDFVNTILGNGTPQIQAQAGTLAWLAWLACGQETCSGGGSDVQTLTSTATGGTFAVEMNGYISTPIAFDATAEEVQTALIAATNVSDVQMPIGSYEATGGPLPADPVVITAAGPLTNMPFPDMTVDNTNATGGDAAIAHTTVGVGFTHVATPSDAGGFWSTWFKAVGSTTNIKHQFNDTRISSLMVEASSASKVAHATPTLISLDPGEIQTTNPTKEDDGTIPFIFTEGMGEWTIDDIVFRGHSAFSMTATWGLTEWYGDDVRPYALVNTRAMVALNAITIILDEQGLGEFNQIIYGQRNPPAGTKPISVVSPLGSYSAQLTKVNPYTGLTESSAAFEFPTMKWDPGLSIPPNVAGGPIELALAGAFRKIPGQIPFTITTVNQDPAYTA